MSSGSYFLVGTVMGWGDGTNDCLDYAASLPWSKMGQDLKTSQRTVEEFFLQINSDFCSDLVFSVLQGMTCFCFILDG